MNLTGELQKLASLYQSGSLSGDEFMRAKERLLGGLEPPSPTVSQELDHLRRENDLLRLDDNWRMERETFLVTSKFGVRRMPSKAHGVTIGVGAALVGGLWMAFDYGIFSRIPGDTVLFKLLPLLFGLVFICVGFGVGIYIYKQADALEKAEARYRNRRARLLDGGSLSGELRS